MKKKRDLAALIFALLFPTLVTLVYFQWLKDSESAWQQFAYGVGKVLQFGFPIVFVWCCYGERLRKKADLESATLRSSSSSTPALAIAFGVAVAIAMFAIYFLAMPVDITEKLKLLVIEKITSIGFDSPLKYFGLAVFYAAFHSLMEEYYWRWFVFDLIQRYVPTWMAILVSSLGFMAHHVIVLGFFFGWAAPWTYLLSLSIAVGGSVWAWLYNRDQRLRNVWISHAIVDAAIFGLGYFLVFQ